MMTQGQDVVADLKRLIAEGCLSEAALHALTRIESGKLVALLADDSSARPTADGPVLSHEEAHRVSILAAQLTYGFEIADDDRLRGILESLTGECRLTLRNIARLTRLDFDDVTTALHNPGALPSETKYKLALRASYLINAANRARTR